MIKKALIFFGICLFTLSSYTQNVINVVGIVNPDDKSITVSQTIIYKNTSDDTLNEIYLNDWNNSYATKSTALAKRFEEEFSTKFHLANDKQRGFTTIESILDTEGNELQNLHLENQIDVIKVNLKSPLLPNESYEIKLKYTIVLPDATFTDYGFTENDDFQLKYWYLTPTVYDGQWQYYSNKNLDDLYIPKAELNITLNYPKNYNLVSELNTISENENSDIKTTILKGNNRVDTYLSLSKNNTFNQVTTDDFTLVSDIYEKGLSPQSKAIITDRVTGFLMENLGEYPHERLLVSQIDYNKNPLYGLNQLPSFLRPFKSDFQYELKLLKTALNKYIYNISLVNPRKEHWLNDGLSIYFLMKYVEDYYPNSKLLGTLANVWGIRSFHLADLSYNAKYTLYYMESARKNNDQAITKSKDSLTKFNANIAGRYKTGVGLNYLDDYATDIDFRSLAKDYLSLKKLKTNTPRDFETYIKSKTSKNIDWFFEDYIDSRNRIDFKISKIKTTEDSIQLTIKNKRENNMPISLFSLKNDSVINKIWLDNITDSKTLTIPNNNTDRLVLDYDNVIPEFNQRDNYRSTKGSAFWSKPLQFRLFKDVEDPYYNQVFFMPLAEFKNIYDGFTLGTKVYNKTILRKRLNYRFSPQYALRSKSLTGSGTIFYTHNLEDSNLFNVSYGISASYRSFAQDAFFRRIRPNISFSFRDKDDLRSDKRETISLRYVDIARSIGTDAILDEIEEEPDYGVLNLRYIKSSPGIINFSRFFADVQFSSNFSKVSVNYEYRKLTKSNRNINLRLFAGTFLKNNTDSNSNFFSFALDRPTDYLFDFNYLGRSEASGIFSQQLIVSEGGFKSRLEDSAFANQWMATANFSTSIWRYIEAYGDVGFVKNKFTNANFVYDSGIRLNLVPDYLELYFPVYSNNGWEIAERAYAQNIRFVVTVDPQVLLGLFRRKWY
ncbi:metalloprotease [Winogradskyella sp. PC-19]|uniref:metalloprotease n=1 Tax=unclassified Winogradskyella TaxID=2615021 RepID=UPI000B3C6AB1|nr:MULTISPECIES: metalloprotease [unclassified Winogradskyella]ARV08684.1 metalloprotease [Winogradskyella sp. PC-19]RZN82084.1 MAG: metalloprotease [Winogradskyella sp.]